MNFSQICAIIGCAGMVLFCLFIHLSAFSGGDKRLERIYERCAYICAIVGVIGFGLIPAFN